MKTPAGIILLFVALLISAGCSYTPEEQARYTEKRAYWEFNNGYDGYTNN